MNPVIDYIIAANNLRAEHEAGQPPVPGSAYVEVSPPHTHQFYQTVVENVGTMLTNAAFLRGQTTMSLVDATLSLNITRAIMSVAAAPQEEIADSLNIAARHLTDAAASSQSNEIMFKLMDASISLRRATIGEDVAQLMTEAAESLKNVAESAPDHEIVFIYDVEEVAMLSRNYVAEFLTRFPDIFITLVYQLVERVLTRSGFRRPDELLDGDLVNIEDPVPNEMDVMRVAPKYNQLRQLYNEISNENRDDDTIVSYDLIRKCGLFESRMEVCEAAAQLQEALHQRWQSVKQCLDLVNKRSIETQRKFANVVISREGVGYGISQILVAGCAPFIPIEHVFSTAKTSKDEVFHRIQQRFGEKCILVYVTSPQTSYIPQMPNVRVWPVDAADSIETLYHAQNHLLR